MVYTFNRSKLK